MPLPLLRALPLAVPPSQSLSVPWPDSSNSSSALDGNSISPGCQTKEMAVNERGEGHPAF